MGSKFPELPIGSFWDRLHSTPDGEQCVSKFFNSVRYSTFIAGVGFLYDVTLLKEVTTLFAFAMRSAHYLIPGASMGAAYASTVCLAGNLRKKDGALNHFLGGCAAGAILGIKYRSYAVGFPAGVAVGLTMAILKTSVIEDWHFKPDHAPMKDYGGFHQYTKYKIGGRTEYGPFGVLEGQRDQYRQTD